MEQHFFLTRETNRPDMLAWGAVLLFYLAPVGIIGPRAGDVIAFEGLAAYIEEAKPIDDGKHNWSVKIYGPDVGKLREKLTYRIESRERQERGELARRYAVAFSEMGKIVAYFKAYAVEIMK